MNRVLDWIVIADGSRAWFVERLRAGAPLVVRDYVRWPLSRLRPSELMSDRSGNRAFASGRGHAALPPTSEAHRQAVAQFARRVAGIVNDAAEHDMFRWLRLVAPPRMLGLLRGELGRRSLGRVASEHPLELTTLPPTELLGRLEVLVPSRGVGATSHR